MHLAPHHERGADPFPAINETTQPITHIRRNANFASQKHNPTMCSVGADSGGLLGPLVDNGSERRAKAGPDLFVVVGE